MSSRYTTTQINHIIQAYRTLFPHTQGALATYWDYERKRLWSCLTTNFHQTNIDAIQNFDVDIRECNRTGSSDVIAERFRELSRKHRVGYSIGISPWTDDLLLRTFKEETKRIIIILAHDWYPIVVNTKKGRYAQAAPVGQDSHCDKLQYMGQYVPASPLCRDSLFDKPQYKEAIPDELCQIDNCAILFMNLYPDFRSPEAKTMGALGDYERCIIGLEAVCKAVTERFHLQGMISWGSHVWQALRSQVEGEHSCQGMGIMRAVGYQQQRGKPLKLQLNGVAVPYYAFAHPSFSTNFKKTSHWTAYLSACSILANS